MKSETRAELAQFITRLSKRIEKGEDEYGDTSFDLPMDNILCEIEDELLDICGWTFVLFVRLEKLRKNV